MSEIFDTNEENIITKSTDFSESAEDAIAHGEAEAVAKKIAAILDSKKAQDVKILNVHKKTILADFFVFATGSSTTQVNSLADEVEYRLSREGISPLRAEGQGSGSWVLIDYGSIIVHVFGVQSKDFYKLDKLWGEAEEVPFDKIEEN